jgi:release factor glutamine methyltransferase
METVLEILKKTETFFKKYGVETPRLDAEHLVAHVLDCNRMQLYLDFERPLQEDILEKLRPLLKRRASREPLQYILGTAAFMDFELKVDARCLIPRPETEELLELVFEETDGNIGSCIDLGTGSGAIACALARKYPGADVVATDISEETLELALHNAASLGLKDRIKFVRSSWFEAVDQTFDLIVSNPPYLSDAELNEIEPEVADFEPAQALSSGPTGLEAINELISNATKFLNHGGSMFLEVGSNQAQSILSMAEKFSNVKVVVKSDLAGKNRFVTVRAVD